MSKKTIIKIKDGVLVGIASESDDLDVLILDEDLYRDYSSQEEYVEEMAYNLSLQKQYDQMSSQGKIVY
jgi:hypothetical protein